jgi:hypothetical protein
MQRHLLDGPLLEQSCHLCVGQGVVGSLRRSGEALSRKRQGQWGREGWMVSLHGLQQLRGRLQLFIPKRKEVAQSAPDVQMVVGWGQIKRLSWQDEGSGLGTLSPGPPPLPPLMDSLILWALPLLVEGPLAFPAGPEYEDFFDLLDGFFLRSHWPPFWGLVERGLKLGFQR